MSKYDEQLEKELEKLKKKKKQDLTSGKTSTVVTSTKPLDLYNDFIQNAQTRRTVTVDDEDDKFISTVRVDDDIAPVKSKDDEDDLFGLDFFQKGAFDDGYQFGDVTKTILGTAGDIGLGAVKGIASLGEGIGDLVNYGIAGVADIAGHDEWADKHRKKTSVNLVENWSKGADDFLDQYSILGRTSDSIMQGVGQVGGIIATGGMGAAAGLSGAGVTALTTGVMGLSGMGSGMGEAYMGGASDEEALAYGAISGAADALSELLFGGLGKAVNAVGFNKGLLGVDDLLAKKVSNMFSSQLAKNIAEFGIKAGAEGFEEVVAGTAQAIGKKLTYMSEEEFSEILEDENLLEQFVVGAVTSGIAQSPSLHIANTSGRDFVTDYSQNEQAVIKKEVENRIAEKEADGTKLTKKEKAAIEAQVEKDMEKGYISTDTIEEVLGGETYQRYKQTIDSENALAEQQKALQEEYDTLNKMKQGEMTGEQVDRRAELKSELAELKETIESQKNHSPKTLLKQRLSDSVTEMVRSDRLIESYNERTRKTQAFEADLTKYDTKQRAVIEKAVQSGILNNTNRTHEFVDMVAKISADKGVLFDFTNNEKLKESGFAVDGKAVNGYVTKDGITVNIQSSKALNSIVGHEITHVLEGTDLYTELQNAVVEYAKTKGDFQGRYDSLTKLYENVEGANIDAELTADLIGDYLFTDADFINNLSTNHRNVFQKIYDEVKYLLKVATAGSKEARELEKVKRAFEKAYREGENAQQSEEISDTNTKYSLREEAPPKETGIAYKVFFVKDGKLYPPMVANPDGADTPMGVWLNADVGTAAPPSKTGRAQVKAGGKGTQGGSGSLAFRPGWHLGDLPRASQFDRVNPETGKKELFPENFVWAEVEYAKDVDYQEEAMSYGYTDKGKFRHAYAGLPRLPENGYYRYRTNPKPDTVPWVITGAMKVNRLLSDAEVNAILEKNGVPAVHRQGGDVGLDKFGFNEDGSVKYSLSDTQGRQLSNEQAEYFKDSVVRDENGNLKVMYHGTSRGGHTVFDTFGGNHGLFGIGSYFTDSNTIGESYTKKGKGNNKQVYETYLNIKNPMDMDAQANPSEWAKAFPDADFPEAGTNEDFYRAVEEFYADQWMSKWDVAEAIRGTIEDMGYDGLTHIGGGRVNPDGERHQVYIAFYPEQIKNVDNAKPTDNPDIRYSLSADSDGNNLTKEQEEYFKKSKMRDADGNLKVMYHGSQNGGFHVFDPAHSDDDISLFFVDRNDVAMSYSGTSETYAARTFHTAEDFNKFFAEIGAEEYEVRETDGKFHLYDDGDLAAVSGTAEGIYEEFKDWSGLGYGDVNYKVYLNLTNPYVVDAKDNMWHDLTYYEVLPEGLKEFYPNGLWRRGTTRDVAKYAKEQGFDGVIFNNIRDNGAFSNGSEGASTVAIAFNSNQIKSVANTQPTGNADIRYSLSDSNGKKLSAEQSEYFKDSKAVDENGNLKVVYHGTRNADFTVFKRNVNFFTDSKEMADSYSPNGAMYEGYVNITKPYEIDAQGEKWSKIPVDAETKKFLQEYGASVFKEGGKWRTTPADIASAIEEAVDNGDMDYDGIIIRNIDDTGSYYKDSGSHVATDYIVFNSNQFKNADNTKPTADKDIRFSLSEAVEETKDLMALHNLHSSELMKQLEMGGMPYPSIAITKPAEIAHNDFGEISLILNKDAIDPKKSKYNHIYSSDAYTPTFPHVSYEANREAAKSVIDRVNQHYSNLPDYYRRSLGSLRDYTNLNDVLNRWGGADGLFNSFVDDHGMKQLYLSEKGDAVPMEIKRTETQMSDHDMALYQKVIDKLGVDALESLNDRGNYDTLGQARIAWTKEHLDVLKDIYAEDWSADGIVTKAEALEIANEQKLFFWYKEAVSALEFLEKGGLTVTETEDLNATNAKVDEKIAGSDYKQWLRNLFSGIEGQSGIRNNKETFTPRGNRRSFSQLHDPVTIDNVIKAMRKKEQTGQGAFGTSNFNGAAVQEYGTIAETKRNANMLGVIDETEYLAIKQRIDDELRDISMRYAAGKDIIDAKGAIVEAVAKNESKAGIARYLKQYDYVFKYTDAIGDDIIELRDYVRSLPRPYFEAKPRRAVGFDEVAAFVIPYDADAKLKQELLNRGYNIAEYDPNVEGDRQRVVNQFEEYKFSLSNMGENPTEYGKYNVYGKDIALEAPVAENATTETQLTEENATVAENATVSEMESVEDLFPDDLAPVQEEIDNLLVQQADIRGAMEAMVAIGDYDGANNLLPEYEDVTARINELQQPEAERVASLDDADVPPEMEAPYQGEETEVIENPFEDRDWYKVGNPKVKAYMYENPEVKPFFQEEALALMSEWRDTTRGERFYNDQAYLNGGNEEAWTGVSRNTSKSMEILLDSWHMSYDDIEKGLNAIIEDNGAENIAAAKKIEFMLNDRLLNGYTDFYTKRAVPPNQDYINLLNEKQINEYSKEAFDRFMATADQYAPEDIAPVAPATPVAQVAHEVAPAREYEAITPKRRKEPKMVRVDSFTPEQQKIAEILDSEPAPENKKSRAWAIFKANVLDKGAVFEDLSLKHRNRELMGKWNFTLSSEARAQHLMGSGADGVMSLNDIREEVGKTGLTKQFTEYLYHKHNVDRMQLADRFEDTPNKPVFGDSVTAEVSKRIARQYETTHPEFREFANDVYNYMSHLRQLMVDNGVISEETARLWRRMYPHYVPIRRVNDTGFNIDVPLDTGRTTVNAPVKRATGGNSDILPLFDTMAQRTLQTYKAIAKNSFGVELKNTLGTTIENNQTDIDEVIDSIDAQEGLLQEGKNGRSPTFTVFENGEKVTFEITQDMYDALKPMSEGMKYTNKFLNTASNLHRGVLTEYNPVFMLTNAIKDTQDVLINSQHPLKTYSKIPEAHAQILKKGYWYQEYMANGGEQNTYFDNETASFDTEHKGLEKLLDVPPLSTISKLNNTIEMLPRLSEYIASREAGRSVEVSMLDAARVTTNFSAGGNLTKLLNRNGATFLNASVQGFMQNVRNVREAKANGMKGWVNLATKFAMAGLPALILNNLVWDDDDEYEELSDYVKQSYYIVGKTEDGKFIRIPKGRTLAVIQNAFDMVSDALTGDDEVDLNRFLELGSLAISNLAPNNPLDNNILAPITQVLTNTTWYGEDLVPTRLQDLPAAQQYDESTDAFSKWLGEKLNISPVKINYLLDQYSGGLGDSFLPMLTPEAESGDNSFLGNILAPLKSKFTTDSVMNNQNVADFYDTKDELSTNAKASVATDEDVLMSKYMNSINAELSNLYAQKRDIQNSDLPDDVKYEQVREVQKQIVALTKEGLNTYEDISYEGDYARIGDRVFQKNDEGEWQKLSSEQLTKYEVTKAAGDAKYASDGTNHYRWYEPSEDAGDDVEAGWRKVSEKELERQNEVTSGLGISPEEYWGNKDEYSYAYDHPENYAVAKAVGGYEAFKQYSSELYDIKADKDSNGKSISGSRKEKVQDYINNLDADYGEKIILFKSEYPADDTYNYEIIDYLNSREDISYEEMNTILKKLGFTIEADGVTITWD